MNLLFFNKFIFVIIGLITGLSLFIFGIKIIASSFKAIVSTKIKFILDKLTSNKLIAIFIGIIITALLQSSSATTVLIISLVDSNLLNIYNAVPIIMGANIGTTFTAQIIAHGVNNTYVYLLPLSLFLFLLFHNKNKKFIVIPRILFGLSIIFIGIDLMSFSVYPLKSTKFFSTLIVTLSKSNLMSICAGIILTIIIHSSSTGIVLLQIMVSSKIIPVAVVIPILLGQNIGTCVDAFIGSLATNTTGKQTATIHIMFNILGALIFYFFIDDLYSLIYYLSPLNLAKQVANAHTIFNVVTTMILLPFSSLLVKFSQKIIKE